MKHWVKSAIALLESSLKPVPTELNELDWKSDISSNKDKLTKHLSAFANNINGVKSKSCCKFTLSNPSQLTN